MELRTPELASQLAARKNKEQQQNINALNITLSSHFLMTLADLKKQWTDYRQEVKSYLVHNHTGMKISMLPEGDSGEYKFSPYMYLFLIKNREFYSRDLVEVPTVGYARVE